MKPEEYYRYYKLSGETAKKVNAEYKATVPENRSKIIAELFAATGAIVFCERHDWGENGTFVSSICFPADHPFEVPVKILNKDKFEGRDVVIVSGKGNTKEARSFNAKIREQIDTANKKLKDAPTYIDYLIKHFNIQCCTIGAPMGRGAAMISTHCGQSKNDENVLVFAIPNANGHANQPSVPPEFVEITYGQFYDLTN
ncbi:MULTISPECIES: DUF5420 family protein [Aeromonas]|uniref:DUF5420 family protein n=1 Tax=Aeromonas TaxID=642 RepID=UPI002B05A47C|nr:DUF5420 family protein [Aeromonas jandaei]